MMRYAIPHLLAIGLDPSLLTLAETHLIDDVDEFSGASSLQDGISLLIRRSVTITLIGGSDCLQAAEMLLRVHPLQAVVCVFPGDIPDNAFEVARKIGVRAVVSKPLNMHYLKLLLKAIVAHPRAGSLEHGRTHPQNFSR
jgi:hypothetical protein